MRATTFEVYGAGVGFLGWVTARTARGAMQVARQLWPDIKAFSVTQL